PLTEQQGQRADDDRLPCSGLTGERVQSGLETQRQALDDGEVENAQLDQHTRRNVEGPAGGAMCGSAARAAFVLEAPVQLAPQRVEEALRREAHERNGRLSAANDEPVLRTEVCAVLSIDGEDQLAGGGQDLDRDLDRVGQHQRPQPARVRPDRRRQDAVHGGVHYGSGRRQRVRGGARRRGEDDSVGGVLRDLLPVGTDEHREPNGAGEAALMQDGIIQGEERRSLVPVAIDHARFQREPLVQPVVTAEDARQRILELVWRDRREEAEVAEVDAEHGDAARRDESRAAQQCAVTAERDEQVDVVGAELRRAGEQVEQFLLRTDLDVLRLELSAQYVDGLREAIAV